MRFYMNKTIIIMISIIVIIGAIFTAGIIYRTKLDNTQESNITEIADEEILDDCTEEYQEIQNKMLEANSQEEKISPNCYITFKTFFKKCGHETSKYLKIPNELVNKTKQDFIEKYKDWNIEKFSDTEIIITREEEGECNEHYIVRENNGKVVVYEVLEDGTEKEYQTTDISTEYLTETDKRNMEKGIEVNGKQNLNQLIEDYE